MEHFTDLLNALNDEKRGMGQRGTQYRQDTAILASEIVYRLASERHELPLTKEGLLLFIHSKYSVDEDRANDVIKAILVQQARLDDQERLSTYYQVAQKRLDERSTKK